MKTIGAFSAKTHLSELLEQVGRGESFVITKRGKPVASLAPVSSTSRLAPKNVVLAFRKRFAKSLRPFTAAEIAELKENGRR